MFFPFRDHNPSGRQAFVCYLLIAANVGVFLAYWLTIQDERTLQRFFLTWGLVPGFVTEGVQLHTLITSMFLHGGWMHIFGNMLFLWVYGDNLEDQMGHFRFLLFYLACGLAAAALQIAVDPSSNIPVIGASGAIAGVLGGYLLLFPKARVDVLIFLVVFIRVVPIPAFFVLGAWFVMQIFSGLTMPSAGGGVAYWAHAGGFIAGLVLALPLWLARGGTRFWYQTHGAPPHPEAVFDRSRIPVVRRMR